MGISNNAPTMSYIHISGTSVVWNNETYMVQDFATNKRYIYWNADTPHQLNASNVMPNRSTKQYLVIVNDNGMHSLVPSTSDDFSISFEGNSNQAIKDRIFGLYEKNEEFGDKFVAIEQGIDGIKSIVGETEETTDGTLIDRMSKIEQRADEINLSVEEVSKKYNDDKETNELRENLNSSIIKLNSTLGTFKSELTDYFKNNEVSSEEQVKIKTQLEILKNNKIILEGYVNTVRLIAESNNQTQDVVALDSAKKSLQIAHDNLHNNVTNAIIDSIITPTENTIIIDSFAKYNLKINELKNTCDDIIILGVGGVITEELANISIKSNEIKLSVSKVEEDFKNDMSIQKLELEGQIRDVNSALGTFEETVNTTFKDGIIDESEKSLLKEKINLIDKEKVDIDLKYNSIYSDTNLSTDIKSELKLKYNNYSNKHSELKSKIESVISDSLINDTEKKEVDTLFKQYANTLAYFHDVINKAIENIAFNSSNAELKKAKEELQNEVSDVSDSVNDLSDTMHGAFQDGILSESEKIAIRQNLSILASEKSDIDKQYTTIYANADLTGTPKTNLKTAYDNYVVSYNSLISTINTILGKSSTVNSTDRNNLTNAFNTHNTKLGLYTVSANNALDSIATKKAQNESSKIDKKYAEIILDPETGIKSMVGHLTQKIDGEGGIEQRLQTAEQTITPTGITNIVKDTQLIKDINGKITTNTSNISEIEQTANSITSRVDGLDGKYTQLKQTVDSIDITGKVSFSDLSTSGRTTINGANITTGTIDTNRVNIKGGTTKKIVIANDNYCVYDGTETDVNRKVFIGFRTNVSTNVPSVILGYNGVNPNVDGAVVSGGTYTTYSHYPNNNNPESINQSYGALAFKYGAGATQFSTFNMYQNGDIDLKAGKSIYFRPNLRVKNNHVFAITDTSVGCRVPFQCTSSIYTNGDISTDGGLNASSLDIPNVSINSSGFWTSEYVASSKIKTNNIYNLSDSPLFTFNTTHGHIDLQKNLECNFYTLKNPKLYNASYTYSIPSGYDIDVDNDVNIMIANEDITEVTPEGEVTFCMDDMIKLLYKKISEQEKQIHTLEKEIENLKGGV